jgi:hypothetical protein
MVESHEAQEDAGDPLSQSDDSGISVQERIDLSAQIEKIVADARTPVTRESLAYTPRRSGLLFPLSLNIAAVAVIASAALIFALLFSRQEQTFTGRSGTVLTGDRTLVSTMRREAEDALKAKEGEIGQIQGALDQTTKRLDTLKADADAQVQKKEQELRASFDQQLSAERTRMQNQGASRAAIDRQLAALRDQLQSSYDVKLRMFRDQVNADMAQKQAALATQLSQTQKSLAQAQGEKAQVQAQMETASRTAAAAQGEQARLAQQVAALAAEADREQLVLDQISASYAAVGAAMKASRFDDATRSLSSLASFLDQAGVASLPAVQRRKPVDLFLIDSLARLVVVQKAGAQPAPVQSTAGAATAVQAVSPRDFKTLTDAAAAGDALFAAGNFGAALEKYGAAVAVMRGVPGMDRLGARIAEAGYRQGAAPGKKTDDSAALGDRIAAVSAGLVSAGKAADDAASSTQKELIPLLDAKVKVKAILSSDGVQAQYPGIAASLDRYIQLFGDEKRAEGRAVALQDISTVLDFLAGTRGRDSLAPVWKRYGDQEDRAAFQQVLDRLRRLSP